MSIQTEGAHAPSNFLKSGFGCTKIKLYQKILLHSQHRQVIFYENVAPMQRSVEYMPSPPLNWLIPVESRL